MPGKCQTGDIVDRVTQGADGAAGGKCKGGRGAVDAHHTPRVRSKLLKIAAIDEMDAMHDPKAARPSLDVAPPMENTGIERMLLDEEMGALWSMPAKAFQYVGHCGPHVWKR